MTLIYELDLDIPNMYLCAKNEVYGSMLSKLELKQDRHTGRQTRPNLLPRRVRGWQQTKART